ncbi:MAG: ethanolamine utilization protein EutN [Acidobacteria bacterium]|nr:MAG: ethanolamine utilization protein EutN [Acidobacteriota bacterium]
MILGRVAGTVVATQKDERLEGFKLLIVQAVEPDGRLKDSFLVAVDTMGAGNGELVLVVSGSSARMVEGCSDRPVDAAIAGIVDDIDLLPSEGG